MKLSSLIKKITINSVSGPLNEEVLGIAYHSKQVQPNVVFVAMRGLHHNGHDFIAQAIRKGAKAVIAASKLVPSNYMLFTPARSVKVSPSVART